MDKRSGEKREIKGFTISAGLSTVSQGWRRWLHIDNLWGLYQIRWLSWSPCNLLWCWENKVQLTRIKLAYQSCQTNVDLTVFGNTNGSSICYSFKHIFSYIYCIIFGIFTFGTSPINLMLRDTHRRNNTSSHILLKAKWWQKTRCRMMQKLECGSAEKD